MALPTVKNRRRYMKMKFGKPALLKSRELMTEIELADFYKKRREQ